MLQRTRNWFAEAYFKPKSTHSLEQLRYLHYLLNKNTVVSENNRGLLVETLRLIAEILIWGDQNDSKVFDFFLEKNMLLYFLNIMAQPCGTHVTIQLLQTLNILFENIRHETSLYFLLSNNNINAIIVHDFDFGNEEVLAYYISFLKTLSFRLNKHTINFFYNQVKDDFPLYTEAIRFFDHSESMVRIAVRTLTLNVYRVQDPNMMKFVCTKTALPYFSCLVWHIGCHSVDLDNCLQNEADHFSLGRLTGLVADQMDLVSYLQDIFSVKIERICSILTAQLLHKLFVPLYLRSLLKDPSSPEESGAVSRVVALFLLSLPFTFVKHMPLLSTLLELLLSSSPCTLSQSSGSYKPSLVPSSWKASCPAADLPVLLEHSGIEKDHYHVQIKLLLQGRDAVLKDVSAPVFSPLSQCVEEGHLSSETDGTAQSQGSGLFLTSVNMSPAEKLLLSSTDSGIGTLDIVTDFSNSACTMDPLQSLMAVKDAELSSKTSEGSLNGCCCLRSILESLDCREGDEQCFYALGLLYSILTNAGLEKVELQKFGLLPDEKGRYSVHVAESVLRVLHQGVQEVSRVRYVTMVLARSVLTKLLISDSGKVVAIDTHRQQLEDIRIASLTLLRKFFKWDDAFLDTFEEEHAHNMVFNLDLPGLLMDASILLPPTSAPLTGVDLPRRLPCGDTEHLKKAIHNFLLMRQLSLVIAGMEEDELPLTQIENQVKEQDVIDLNKSDLLACTVVMENSVWKRFLFVDSHQFILVEPDVSRRGWGVVKFICMLKDVELITDKGDSSSVKVRVHRSSGSARAYPKSKSPASLVEARLLFDDYIRCMSAKQRIQRRLAALRQSKLSKIARLMEISSYSGASGAFHSLSGAAGGSSPGKSTWSPSSRLAGGRHVTRSPSNPQGNHAQPAASTPRASPHRSMPISPLHSKILAEQLNLGIQGVPRVSAATAEVRPPHTRTQAETLAELLYDQESFTSCDDSDIAAGDAASRCESDSTPIGQSCCLTATAAVPSISVTPPITAEEPSISCSTNEHSALLRPSSASASLSAEVGDHVDSTDDDVRPRSSSQIPISTRDRQQQRSWSLPRKKSSR